MERGSNLVQYLVTVAVSIAAVNTGVVISWSTTVIPKFHANETSIQVTDSDISWIAALSSPGFMVGGLASRYIADYFGRRVTILGSAIPVICGTVLAICTTNSYMLYLMKFIWGCGIGIFGAVSSYYIAEIADKNIRGTLSMGIRFMSTFGSFLVLCVGPFVSYTLLNYCLLVLPIIHFILCWWIPETPYYLLKEGKVNKARKVLRRLSGFKNEKNVEDKLSALQIDVKKEMRKIGTLKELLTGNKYRRAIIIVIGLKITQIMSGSIATQQYAGLIVEDSEANITVSTALIVLGATRLLVGIVSSILVDRVGRRPLLIWSYFATSLFHFATGLYFFFQEVIAVDKEVLTSYSFIPFAGIIGQTVASTLGFNSIVYMIPAELFPLNVKAVAITSLYMCAGMLNFGTVKSYQATKDVTGLCGVFWFYAVMSFIGYLFSYFMVIETKGKSLREIQEELQGALYEDSDVDLKDVSPNDASNEDIVNETTELNKENSKQV